MATDEIIKERAKARADARIAFELAELEFSGETYSADATNAFWTELRDLVLAKAPLPIVAPAKVKVEPMTNRQAELFEHARITFGKFENCTVVPGLARGRLGRVQARRSQVSGIGTRQGTAGAYGAAGRLRRVGPRAAGKG